jgi:hypothetical protein
VMIGRARRQAARNTRYQKGEYILYTLFYEFYRGLHHLQLSPAMGKVRVFPRR